MPHQPQSSAENRRQSPDPQAVGRPLTPDHYLAQITPSVRDSLTPDQWAEVSRVVNLALPKPSPKLIDLRVDMDLLISRYYIVIMVGKDRRRSARPPVISPVTRWVNWVAAVLLLLGFNLAVSVGLFLLAYLLKSALGINLLPGHFRGFGN
jgi:hypothetical protein